MNALVEWFMNRYRGTSGVFGRIVLRADVRWLRRAARAAKAASVRD